MLNRIAKVLGRNHVSTGFQAYLNQVRQQTGQYGPTMDEAKRDFKRMSYQRYGDMG